MNSSLFSKHTHLGCSREPVALSASTHQGSPAFGNWEQLRLRERKKGGRELQSSVVGVVGELCTQNNESRKDTSHEESGKESQERSWAGY